MGIVGLVWLCIGLVLFISGEAPVRRSEETAFWFHATLGIVAPFALLVGSWSVDVAETVLFGVGLVVGTFFLVRARHSKVPRPAARNIAEILAPVDWVPFIAIVAVIFLMAVSLNAPTTGWDATTAHASVPAQYVRSGHIHLLPGNVYSAYPQFVHTLTAMGIRRNHDFESHGFTYILSILSCGAVYGLAHRLGGRTAGLIAAAMFATSPIFIAQASTVAIDVPFTGFIASALLGLVIWDETKSVRYLIVAGVIAGAACGIRHTGYLAAFLMFAWVLMQSKDSRAKLPAIFAASVAIASVPWWLRSWILVGNPVYPLFTSIFGDGGMPDVQVTAPLQHETARGVGVLDFLTFPWRIAMHPQEFDGWQASPGGLVSALGVVGVLWGGRMARWLGGFSLAGILTIYMVQRFARYALPFFMPLHVTGALAATRPGPLRRPIAVLLVLTYIYGLGLAVATTYPKWPVVFGQESREEYLTRRVERYPAFQWLNEHLPEQAVVLTLDPRSFYIQRDSFQNLAALEELRGKSVDEQLAWMKARRIRYIFIPDAYVAGSPIFRERGLAPLIDQWRVDARFRAVYDEELPDPRGGGTERVTILEVVGGDGGGPA